MADQVAPEVAAARRGELMAAQQDVHFAKNGPKVGLDVDVLVETVDPLGRSAVGRTEHDAPDVDGHVRIISETTPIDRLADLVTRSNSEVVTDEL